MMDPELHEYRLAEELRLSGIESEISGLKTQLTALQQDVAELVSAWKAASALAGFIKFLGAVALSFGAIVAYLKGQ